MMFKFIEGGCNSLLEGNVLVLSGENEERHKISLAEYPVA
jgi:hypothetical protein